ncbi:hypothetical protein ANN_04994 [Periplaneta americana]|uniref:Transposase Tc1-like domain-containing protein n=1 Tax=Periplaneta americana TaxID=6978 RepID=A0ABQ8TBJ0_PERAM|nr:hypothetical protein ANN_04994 [Periplaneta americana]
MQVTSENRFPTIHCSIHRTLQMAGKSGQRKTVRNRLRDAGLKNYVATNKVYLIEAHIFDHLAYAMEMLNFAQKDVVFSDEVTFLDGDGVQLCAYH